MEITKTEMYLGKLQLKQVSSHQNPSLIKAISIDEISRQIKKLKKGKTPGDAGFRAALYTNPIIFFLFIILH